MRIVTPLIHSLCRAGFNSLAKVFSTTPSIGILYFHRILDKKDPFYPDDFTIQEFSDLMAVLTRYFTITTTTKAIQKIKNKSSKRGVLCLTFDDGYEDNFSLAKPILDKYNIKATFFIATSGFKTGILWHDHIIEWCKQTSPKIIINYCTKYFPTIELKQIKLSDTDVSVKLSSIISTYLKYLPYKLQLNKIAHIKKTFHVHTPILMMNREQIRTLHNEHHIIGAHTHNHVILSTTNEQEMHYEISHSKKLLERVTEHKIRHFAYPNGHPTKDFNEDVKLYLSSIGFLFAFTTEDGGIHHNSSLMSLPRFLPYRRSPHLFSLSALKISGELHYD